MYRNKSGQNALARNGKKKGRGRKSKFARYLADLHRQFGASPERSSGKNFQLFIAYGANALRPQIMPKPQGPRPGAVLTTRQAVNAFATSTGLSGGSSQPLAIVQGGATVLSWQIGHNLSDLGQVSTYSSLFDQYRIDRVHFRLTPRDNSIDQISSTSANRAVPQLILVIDRDDSSTLSSITAAQEYDNCQIVPYGSCGLDVIYEPSITKAVFSSGVFSGYAIDDSGSTWLDIANTTIPHYGLKGVVSALNASATDVFSWQLSCWYEVSFRNIR